MRYLLVTYYRKAGGQIDELIKIAKKVKPADTSTCNVIMDYATRKVEKCVIEGKLMDKDFDKLNNYYKKVYPALIAQLEKEAPITAAEKARR